MDAQLKDIFEQNKQKIMESVDVHPEDAAIIDDSINRLVDLGVGCLLDASLVEADTWGWELRLTDDNTKVYYLQLNSYGGIEMLRKDEPKGEVIFALVND